MVDGLVRPVRDTGDGLVRPVREMVDGLARPARETVDGLARPARDMMNVRSMRRDVRKISRQITRSTSVLLALCLSIAIGGCTKELSWSAVNRLIDTAYPGVPIISTDSLAALLYSDRNESLASRPDAPILLDVRTADEFAVSHLPGAIRVDPGTTPEQLDSLRGRGPIITYCSVGYRSAELASKLIEAGFPDVRNLRGSIFLWANEGRPVYRDGRRVQEVHPYDEIWGVLLDPSLRAELPDQVQP